MKEKLKKKLTNNLGIKLLSLPLAAIIWIIIINIDDPIISRNYTNVAIELQNKEAIASLGKVYEIAEGNTVTVSVTGKRSILDKLRSNDLQVTADLKQMSAFNLIDVEVSCDKFSYSDLSFSTKPKMLTVSLEDKKTKQFKVNIETKGNIDSNYHVGSMEVKSTMVEVSGAESVIEKIADVRVMVVFDGEKKDFKRTKLMPKAYDTAGKEINTSKLEFSDNSITVKVNVQPTKVVPITLTTVGTQAAGYGIIQTDYDPNQIKIAGEASILKGITSIPVTIDITNARATIEKEIMLAEFLPSGVTILGISSSIAVKVGIEKMSTREYTFTASDVEIKNIPETMNVFYSDSNRIYKVTIMGMEEDLEAFSVEHLGAYIDLINLTEGVHLLAIKFQVPENYIVSNNPTISIELVKKDSNIALEEQPETLPENDKNDESSEDDNVENNTNSENNDTINNELPQENQNSQDAIEDVLNEGDGDVSEENQNTEQPPISNEEVEENVTEAEQNETIDNSQE